MRPWRDIKTEDSLASYPSDKLRGYPNFVEYAFDVISYMAALRIRRGDALE